MVIEAVRGVTVPLVTPFKDDDELSVDHATLESHVDWLIAQGAGCLLAADLVGESWALTADEKTAVIRTAVDAADGRVPVVAKLSEHSQAAQVESARRAAEVGADAIKFALPRETAAHGLSQVLDWCAAPVRAARLPFLLESYGDVSMPVLDALCEEDGFVGYEETSHDLVRFFDLATRYRDRVAVVAGAEDVLAYMLLGGAHGLMTASTNFALPLVQDLHSAARSHDAAKTMELFGSLRAIRRLFYDELVNGVLLFASYSKYSLTLLGRPVGPPRPPLRPLGDDEQAQLKDVLERIGIVESQKAQPSDSQVPSDG